MTATVLTAVPRLPRLGTASFTLAFGFVGTMGAIAAGSALRLLWTGAPVRAGLVAALVLGLGLAGLGFGLLLYRFGPQARAEARRRRIERDHPGEPWRLRPDWEEGRIHHSNRGVAAFLWLWCIGWWSGLAIVGGANHERILAELVASPGMALLAAIFPLAGLAAVVAAIRTTGLWLRYGRSTIVLATLPAEPGGVLRATVTARIPALPAAPMVAELACREITRTTTRSSGTDGTRTETRTQVRTLRTLTAPIPLGHLSLTAEELAIPVMLPIPDDLPESSIPAPDDHEFQWCVTVRTAKGAEAPFAATFEIPVFRRG